MYNKKGFFPNLTPLRLQLALLFYYFTGTKCHKNLPKIDSSNRFSIKVARISFRLQYFKWELQKQINVKVRPKILLHPVYTFFVHEFGLMNFIRVLVSILTHPVYNYTHLIFPRIWANEFHSPVALDSYFDHQRKLKRRESQVNYFSHSCIYVIVFNIINFQLFGKPPFGRVCLQCVWLKVCNVFEIFTISCGLWGEPIWCVCFNGILIYLRRVQFPSP